MLSGNGRHRRPRQAPALVVAAGVTGSAIAIPLLGAGSASAADGAVWDRIAECESAGVWSANTGNGFYGGLQFSQETWDKYGGSQYAARPDLASRSQQIAVAEKVRAAEGDQAWLSCTALAGVNAGSGNTPGTGTAPGKGGTVTIPAKPKTPAAPPPSAGTTTPAPESTATTPAPGQTSTDPAAGIGRHRGQPATEPGASAPKPADTAKPADPAAPAKPADPATPAKPADPAAPGATTEPGSPAADRAAEGERASRGETPARPGTTDPNKADVTGNAGAKEVSPGNYTVQPGDNLWAIAEEKKVQGGWPALYEANKKVVGTDPDLIHPGQNLDLAPAQS
jgi:resuscitation-promoting factor RpfA